MPKRSRIKDFLWRHSAGIAFLVMVAFVALIGFVGYTYVVITKKFDSSRRWDLPSRIYSDATPIVPGMTYPRALLEPKLNHVGYHETRSRVANPGEYRYTDGNLEIYLQNFEYPDIEFRALPVLIEFDGSEVRSVKRRYSHRAGADHVHLQQRDGGPAAGEARLSAEIRRRRDHRHRR